MKLGTRLRIAYGVIGALLTLITISILYGSNHVRSTTTTMARTIFPTALLLHEVRGGALRVVSSTNEFGFILAESENLSDE